MNISLCILTLQFLEKSFIDIVWLDYDMVDFYKNMNNTQFTTYGILVIRTYQGQTIYPCLGLGHETMVCIVYS